MGDKTEARRAMQAAGVPIIPGCDDNLKNLDQALQLAAEFGYPVMLKATSGGGGRGIRRCNSAEELRRNYDRVISEATKAFGSANVFMEKCIDRPRHIEVQILADQHGNCIHLFERDCSIQRRHQKLVEIAPSPQLSEEQRQMLGEYAVKAALAVSYQNAGTVEFLMDRDDRFYFMEMNTRLQVEHTISETITGIDIVQEQIRIADGQPLRYRQEEVQRRGYAIEFRINAEDPKNDFLPSFGRITRYFSPGGPGVRTDAAIYSGYSIPPYYDSLCAKLIVWALEWPDVIRRSSRALQDMGVYGVKTTIPYYLELLKVEDVINGRFDTGFVEDHPELVNYTTSRPTRELAAVIGAAIAAYAGH
jgi:pyruvate carboxylase subunit A